VLHSPGDLAAAVEQLYSNTVHYHYRQQMQEQLRDYLCGLLLLVVVVLTALVLPCYSFTERIA